MKKGKIWGILFLVLALFTVWAVISQSKGFSLAQLKSTLRSASVGWMIAAVVSMLGFIVFEGMALLCILRALGYRRGFAKGFLYSAADIYFSAITPSATGGQPASAYFMVRDGIPGAVVTISLVANIIMYTLSFLTVGAFSIIIRPENFFQYHLPGRIFIVAGYVVMCGLAIAFYMLIAKPRILEKICEFLLKVGKKLHIIRHVKKKREKLYHAMKEYRQCALVMADHKFVFVQVYFFDLLQRLSQITVTLFVYLATGGKGEMAVDIWFTQSFATVGAYSLPIPGGMGVADYLLIDGFKNFLDEASAINLELISRGLSFYVSLLVSAVTVLIGMIYTIKRRKSR